MNIFNAEYIYIEERPTSFCLPLSSYLSICWEVHLTKLSVSVVGLEEIIPSSMHKAISFDTVYFKVDPNIKLAF
jgi:hypothetical protein